MWPWSITNTPNATLLISAFQMSCLIRHPSQIQPAHLGKPCRVLTIFISFLFLPLSFNFDKTNLPIFCFRDSKFHVLFRFTFTKMKISSCVTFQKLYCLTFYIVVCDPSIFYLCFQIHSYRIIYNIHLIFLMSVHCVLVIYANSLFISFSLPRDLFFFL